MKKGIALATISILLCLFMVQEVKPQERAGCSVNNMIMPSGPTGWWYKATIVNTVLGSPIVVCVEQFVYYGEDEDGRCETSDCTTEECYDISNCFLIPAYGSKEVKIWCPPSSDDQICQKYEVIVWACESWSCTKSIFGCSGTAQCTTFR